MERNESVKCCKLTVNEKEIDCSDEIEKIIHFIISLEKEQLKIHGFTITQYRCIVKLNCCDCLTMNDISEQMNLEKSTMTRIIDKLVRDGYVIREKCKDDKRITYIRLSESGNKAAIQIRNLFGEYYTRVLSHIPNEKLDTVIDSLFIFLDALKKAKE